LTDPEHAFSRCVALAGAALGSPRSKRAADVAYYLAHVEGSAPLRRLSEATGRPLSSIHRAVRRVEALRDDPLLDRTFEQLAEDARSALAADPLKLSESEVFQGVSASSADDAPSADVARILSRLAEPGAFLMVASGAGKAGVFAQANRFRRPVALLALDDAARLAARNLVRATSLTASSARYEITSAGRTWLRRRAGGGSGVQSGGQAAEAPESVRAPVAETPLAWLARRRGADGAAFLSSDEVEAGELLKAAFDAARFEACAPADWTAFLTAAPATENDPVASARAGLSAALEALGPGLADVALLTCCFLEGLEATEKRFGWSARSGKVVLKIALSRLARHYGLDGDDQAYVALQHKPC
jgi:hypothetical protein